MEKADITIIGTGIVGLSIAAQLAPRNKSIVLIEQHPNFGQEASSRNSEVVHSRLYYPQHFLKTRLCIEGKKLLYRICEQNTIPCNCIGKLIIALNSAQEEELQKIIENGRRNGIEDLRLLSSREIQRLEPSINAKTALLSPSSGIVDSHLLMRFFYQKAKQNRVLFSFSTEVVAIKKIYAGYLVKVREPQGDFFSFKTRIVINSAGISADKIAQMVGICSQKYSYKIHYCKGQYFRIKTPRRFLLNHLIYPLPDKISLGIHFTPDMGEGLRVGPDAQYVSDIDYTVNEDDRDKFYQAARKFLPGLKSSDLMPDTAGIRAKLQTETEEAKDFIIKEESEKGFPNFINLIGIDSPGLTAAPAIANFIARIVGF